MCAAVAGNSYAGKCTVALPRPSPLARRCVDVLNKICGHGVRHLCVVALTHGVLRAPPASADPFTRETTAAQRGPEPKVATLARPLPFAPPHGDAPEVTVPLKTRCTEAKKAR